MQLRSTIRLVSDGTVEWVDLTFEVHPEDALYVYFDGERVEQGWTLMRESTPQRVNFDEPIPDGVDVIIRRASDLSEIPHVFHYTGNIKGGAEFNAKNMDENFAKILRASEDAMDSFELVGINVEAALDANLAADRAEEAAEDAEQSYQNTLAFSHQGEQWMLAAQAAAIDAEGSKVAASASEQAAKASEQAAATSESNAKDSELLAEGYAEDAASSESNALSYKQDAETARSQALNYRNDSLSARDTAQQHQQSAEASKDAAATSASQANASAQSAESSKDLAYRWANEPENQPVEQGEFSAYHWAKKAELAAGGGIRTEDSSSIEFTGDGTLTNPLSGEVVGLGTAAERDVGTSSGNVMEVGAFGLGTTANVDATIDPDDIVGTGFYGNFSASQIIHVDNPHYVGTYAAQLSLYTNSDRVLYRHKRAGTWGDPVEFYHTGNILKTTGNNDKFPMSQKAVTDALNNLPTPEGIPSGLISMWSGALNAIPPGWALCDGSNGTPNLTDRFIVAAGGDYAVGDTGDGSIPSHSHGAGSLTAASSGAHSHTASTGSAGSHSHSGSTNSTGAHTHQIESKDTGTDTVTATTLSHAQARISSFLPRADVRATSAGAHSHSLSINSSGAHTHTVSVTSGGAHTHTISGSTAAAGSGSEVIAKYFALAYIMKL